MELGRSVLAIEKCYLSSVDSKSSYRKYFGYGEASIRAWDSGREYAGVPVY